MSKRKSDLANIPCYSFPDCPCAHTVAHWVRAWRKWKATEPPDAPCALAHIPLHVVELMDFRMYCAYRCMAANCSKRKWRATAQMMLLHPGYQELNRRHP